MDNETKKQILIVAQNQKLGGYVIAVLDQAGYRVRAASGVQEALDSLAQDPAALIIAEATLPDRVGQHLAQTLKNETDLSLRLMPVILIGGETGSDRDVAPQNPTTYLNQPLDSYDLLQVVKGKLFLTEWVQKVFALSDTVQDQSNQVILRIGQHRLIFDYQQSQALLNDVKLNSLSRQELYILGRLARQPNQVVEMGTLFKGAFGKHARVSQQAIRQRVGFVVDALQHELPPSLAACIQYRPNQGYSLSAERQVS